MLMTQLYQLPQAVLRKFLREVVERARGLGDDLENLLASGDHLRDIKSNFPHEVETAAGSFTRLARLTSEAAELLGRNTGRRLAGPPLWLRDPVALSGTRNGRGARPSSHPFEGLARLDRADSPLERLEVGADLDDLRDRRLP